MLSFEDVEFNYYNQSVFRDLNFELKPGEFAFVIGKSGIGKTTMLQLIYMNIKPDSGVVKVGEYDSKTIKSRQLPLLRRKLGVIFQDFKLLQDRNVFENLSYVLEVINTSKKEIKRKVNEALAQVGLSHKSMNMPNELSGGEQQRVSIARAILNEPMLILADEPTGNLDKDTSIEIMDILEKINRQGTAVLMATHSEAILKRYQHRRITIDKGNLE